ncbi:MAG: ribonuclease R, partial [Lachnospiraceae bacterium]|nr:ribonuclease R [Lachnospiraceae bacterium]
MEQKELKKRKKIICELMGDPLYVPMKEKELAMFLQVKPEERDDLKIVLNELLAENKIQISKRGKYTKGSRQMLTGTFIGNSRGFGFVELDGKVENPTLEDIFIPEEKINGAMHQDKVEIELLKKPQGKQRQEGQIVRIIERGFQQIVGSYQAGRNYGFVIPDNQKIVEDIFIPIECSKGAMDGHKVVVEITEYGKKGRKPEGKIVEIIGHINDPGVDILSIVRGYELPVEFPEKVMRQAERVPMEISEADREGRMDLRDWQMVTIDGEDAKDLDDAVSLTMEGDVYVLGVHIADVSNYVQENSALDKEALTRGTSVYLVDRVIPMLPHRLSNGICSLNAGEDRLAMSCIMRISRSGEVMDHQIVESVIHVDRRMSYTVVREILEEEASEYRQEYQELVPMFERMHELSGILRGRRKQRGSSDFDLPEAKIILDNNGRPTEIKPYEANAATKLIEDFMLIANETVAAHIFWQELPFLYRVHEVPDADKIEGLAAMLQNFGYYLKGSKGEIHPKEIQKLLAGLDGRPEENLITRLTLRSMKQAKYTTECLGHFGLACKEYCHFTSPIRRYPDLQIHRILKDEIRGRLNDKKISHYEAILDGVAQQCSKLERRADEAERETEKLKKAEYMENKIGECFEGVISGVTGWGLYVELPNTVEGLVHISKIEG